jgi:hypothetical protein
MGIAYYSLARALRAKGWIEVSKKEGTYGQVLLGKSVLNSSGTCSPTRRFISSTHREIDSMLDLKFVLNTQDIHSHNLKKDCFINQNKGEGALTCKTGLYESLCHSQPHFSNWFPMERCDPHGFGIDSFYPRSHLTNTGEAYSQFIKDFLLTYAESYIKSFLIRVTATEEQAILAQVKRRNLIKEKLLVCCALLQRKIKDPVTKLDKKKGISNGRMTLCKVTAEEKALLLRTEKQITVSYIKYLHKEDWYIKIKQKFP